MSSDIIKIVAILVIAQVVTFILSIWVAVDVKNHKLELTSTGVLALSELLITGGAILCAYMAYVLHAPRPSS